MEIIYFLISFIASIIGSICGVGGGIIIKPALDATGTMALDSIGFLSGITVLSMATVSVIRTLRCKNGPKIKLVQSTYLALGGAIGGLVGKMIFDYAFNNFSNQNIVGAIQSICLILITLGTLLYQIKKNNIKTKQVDAIGVYLIIGIALGMISSFLGIGGGPINLIVLAYFFSYDTKTAAINSLYIIMFSQLVSLISTLIDSSITYPSLWLVALMMIGGIAGGLIGSYINKAISSKVVEKLFIALIVLTVQLNIYNLFGFLQG